MKRNIFIERPVLSTVISIIIVLLGVLGLNILPITQYPDIAPPTVQVTANFPGANAQTIRENVIIPLEEQINGVEGMTYITSTASNDGSASIQVFFEQDVDPDIAAVNVQNRVSRANALLPAEVVRSGVITQKRQNSALMYCALYTTSPDYDETFLQNYLNINVRPELQRVRGVGEVNLFGGRDYAMRVWLDPARMAAYSLTPGDVITAINEQSREAAAGALGQNAGESFEYVIRYKGRYRSEEEFANIILRAEGDGQFLRLEDVAKIELDAASYASLGRTRNHPSVSFGIFQTPGSNAREISEELYVKLEELSRDFPEGVEYIINYDNNRFLTASINKVQKTLIEAFLLVFLVVFVFLQSVRSTLIPGIAVPVAIIGTFFFLQILGYSVNLLTLFALVLAIGIVVDDAIVVVEAVYAKLESGEHTSALSATRAAMGEITGAIISITLVMAAVFVPITFIQGPSGVFYEQFGVTLIVAILLSAVNALTLSPALCALFLQSPEQRGRRPALLLRFYAAFNAGFSSFRQKYGQLVAWLVRYKVVAVAIILLAVGSIWWINRQMPGGFVPNEDRGVIFTNIELPPGASLDRTYAVLLQLQERLQDMPGIRSYTLIGGRNFFSGNGSSYGMAFILLDRFDEREADSLAAPALVDKLFARTAGIDDARIIFFTPPSVPGFGASDGFEARLLDRASGDIRDLDQIANDFVQRLGERPEISYANNSFNTNFPQLQLDINVARAMESGVEVSQILTALQGYVGSFYAADFSRFGKQFRVFIQALPEDRDNIQDLNSIMLRNNSGQMIPITQFIELERTYGPQTIGRFNLFNSVTINGGAAPGYSTGDAIAAIEETADDLPKNYSIAFSGITREEIASSGQAVVIFFLSIVFVYFFLAAQYESYLLPFAVLFSLPTGVAGAYAFTWFSGLENNIYFQIALIMLLGLLAKNAILIVEFARQRRQQGLDLVSAALEGAKVRLRPVLMTSLAFVIGLLPLVLAQGVGAVGNRSIGTGAAGGLLIGTLLGVLVIPVLFILFQALHEKVSRKPVARTTENGSENAE